MRASHTIYLGKNPAQSDLIYDPTNGNYVQPEPDRTKAHALVTDTGTERMNLIYGGMKQSAKTVRLNHKYNGVIDFVDIGDDRYQVDTKREYRHKMTLEVSGVNG